MDLRSLRLVHRYLIPFPSKTGTWSLRAFWNPLANSFFLHDPAGSFFCMTWEVMDSGFPLLNTAVGRVVRRFLRSRSR